MFIPITKNEIEKLGWDQPDIILVSGDAYIDSPNIGVAVIGKILLGAGYKVVLIPQPDIESDKDITRFGEPKLFWGVSGGSVDSMVANYTAVKKFRKSDDNTPGGYNNKRPDRASIKYTNLIRTYYKNTKPIVLGGIEASLRRITHYDYWSNKIRKSILFNAKADYLIYGMADKAILKFADKLKQKQDPKSVRGLCYISKVKQKKYIDLPSFAEVQKNKEKFQKMFDLFYHNNDPITAKGLMQLTDNRYLIQNPPEYFLTQEELDKVYEIDFERKPHPAYKTRGKIKALDTIQFSMPIARGCYGECNFCAIAMHEGKTVRWRSEKSIVKSVTQMVKHDNWKGNISDLCSPTANMYGFECIKKLNQGSCEDKRCVVPSVCKTLGVSHRRFIGLLKMLRKIDGVKRVFVSSGIRYDLIDYDKKFGDEFTKELVGNHVSGQLKIAPEHTENNILKIMGKPGNKSLLKFVNKFYQHSKLVNKKQYITYYFIAAHPGCNLNDMKSMKEYVRKNLSINPEQVQIFTPTPSTYSSMMYYTGINPFNGKEVFVERDAFQKTKQKEVLVQKIRYK